jgi:hypothetical protein
VGSHPLPKRSGARPGPTLTVSLGIEDVPHVAVVAGSYEDEQRLLLWLSRSVRRVVDDFEQVVRDCAQVEGKS